MRAVVIIQNRQLIHVSRESVTSFTAVTLIESEKATDLQAGIVTTTAWYMSLDGPPTVMRVDPAPGFKSLHQDGSLARDRMALEIGRYKNLNRNPFAERSVQELHIELLKQDPCGGPVGHVKLQRAVNTLNGRIRERGLSLREMLQRGQFTSSQLPVEDDWLIAEQHAKRLANHLSLVGCALPGRVRCRAVTSPT